MVAWLSVECKIQGSKVGVVVVLRLISREAKLTSLLLLSQMESSVVEQHSLKPQADLSFLNLGVLGFPPLSIKIILS